MANFCKKCEADFDKTEGQHFGACPDHPNNIAMKARLQGQREEPVYTTSDDSRSYTNAPLARHAFILPEATMILPQETIQKAMEVFFKEAMGLDVEVSGFSINTKAEQVMGGYAVTFKGK